MSASDKRHTEDHRKRGIDAASGKLATTKPDVSIFSSSLLAMTGFGVLFVIALAVFAVRLLRANPQAVGPYALLVAVGLA